MHWWPPPLDTTGLGVSVEGTHDEEEGCGGGATSMTTEGAVASAARKVVKGGQQRRGFGGGLVAAPASSSSLSGAFFPFPSLSPIERYSSGGDQKENGEETAAGVVGPEIVAVASRAAKLVQQSQQETRHADPPLFFAWSRLKKDEEGEGDEMQRQQQRKARGPATAVRGCASPYSLATSAAAASSFSSSSSLLSSSSSAMMASILSSPDAAEPDAYSSSEYKVRLRLHQ